jgi:hypothetical protein
MKTDEGYLLVATRNPTYVKLAINAARSLHYYDPNRPVVLAHDDALKQYVNRRHFEGTVKIRRELMGTEHHLFLNELSPFERTFYVDCDCLAVSNRLPDVIWSGIKERGILFPGEKITEGKWRVPIPPVLKKFGISHVVKNNGGAWGFDRSDTAKQFFHRAQKLFSKKPPEITIKHVRGDGYANEPFWGTALSMCGIEPYPDTEDLNVSTRNHAGWSINGGNGKGRYLSIQKGLTMRHPLICHFLGIHGDNCPNDLYRALVAAVH